MADNNFFNVVNASGAVLEAKIDGKTISVGVNEQASGTFATGANPTADINGNTVSLSLPTGVNSWSTLVYTNTGLINVFPSAPNQGAISY
jgi:hypothetical protein